MRTIGLILAAAAATALTFSMAPAVFAADGTISWKGLDLTTDAGRAELDGRIGNAARQICATGPITGTRVYRGPSARCLADARSEIVSRLAQRLPASAFVQKSNGALAHAGGSDSEAR